MGVMDSGFVKRHPPRFSVQVLAAGLVFAIGYFMFSLWDFSISRVLACLLMLIAGVNLAAMIYLKIHGGKAWPERPAKKKEAKP